MADKKLKIAWLHTHFLLSTGATRYVHEVARRLNQKYEVTVFVERTSPLWKRNFVKDGVRVVELLPYSSNSIIYWSLFPYFVRQDVEILRKKINPFDLVISSMFPMNWVAGQLGKPHIQLCVEPFAFFHDPELVASLPPGRREGSKVLAKLYSWYDFDGVSKSERLLTLNRAVARSVREIYQRDPTDITYIGVDSSLFKPTPNRQLEKKYRGKKIILHSTDYTVLKGTNFIIEALPGIVKEVKNAKLVVTQTVDDLAKQKRLLSRAKELGVADNVEFVGHVPYKLLPAYYTLADVVAFTGHPESKGATHASLTVLEALACQTPVVRSIGCDEEVVHGESGLLVDPRKEKKLAKATVKILTRPRLAEEMGRAGRRRVRRLYTWDRVVAVFDQHIERLMAPEQKGLSIVKDKGRTLGMIFRSYVPVRDVAFFTDDMNPLQIGVHQRNKGVKLTPHIHLLKEPLTISSIQEMLYAQSGKIRVTFYSDKGKKIKAAILEESDAVLFMEGGHGVDILADNTRIFEVKQGPYPGTEHAKLYLKARK